VNSSKASSAQKVWLDYDQSALDRAYNQSQYATNMQEVLARYAERSEAYRTQKGAPQRHKYGPSTKESFDFYPSKNTNAATQIFVHGGAWRGGLAKNYAFLAELCIAAGINLLIPDFDRVEDAPNGLQTMVDQICKAVHWAHTNASTLNIDADNLHLFGHSSGAHLVACALTTNWASNYQLPPNVIRSATCTSGIYDLKPVRLSSRNGYLNLTDEIEQALSPERYAQKINLPLIIAHGTKETPEFIRQAQSFASAINAHRAPKNTAQLLELEALNHFEVLETITEKQSALGVAILKQMGDAKSRES
jgi:arylformamidase